MPPLSVSVSAEGTGTCREQRGDRVEPLQLPVVTWQHHPVSLTLLSMLADGALQLPPPGLLDLDVRSPGRVTETGLGLSLSPRSSWGYFGGFSPHYGQVGKAVGGRGKEFS